MPASVTEELAALYTTTWRKVKAKFIPQIFYVTPAMAAFKANNRIETRTGGRKIVVDLDYKKNESIQWINIETGTYDLTKTDPLTENQFDWDLISGAIWARHVHASQNTGPYAITSLQRAFLKNLKNSMAQDMEEDLFTAQSGDSPYGLPDLVSTSPTTGTIGVINRATYDWYRNGEKDCASRPFSSYGVIDMTEAYTEVSKFGTIKDLVILTDAPTWRLYHEEVRERQQIVNKKYADLGFPTLSFMGSPVMWSPQCTAGYMYFLDMEHIWMVVHSKINMDLGPFVAKQGSLDKVAPLLCQCAFVIDRPKSTYVLYGLAA